MASNSQVGMIRKRFADLYPADGEEAADARSRRLSRTSRLARIEYPGIASTKELTADEAATVLIALQRCGSAADLEALIGSGEVTDGQ